MKKRLFGCFLIGSMLLTGALVQNVNAPELKEYAYDAENQKAISVRRAAIGNDSTEATVDVSDTYVQWGKYNGNYRLRFATAVRGPIKSVEYVRTIEGYEEGAEKVKAVTTLYSGLTVGEDTVYFDGETTTTSTEAKGLYYWACYVIEFGSESAYKAANITAKINVVGEDEVETSSVSKTATLNGELQSSVKLTLSSEETVKVVEGEKATLPTAEGSIFGEAAEVKVTDAEGNEIDVANYVPAKGENKITYTVDAPEGFEDVSKTITVFAARKLFKWVDDSVTISNELETDEKQTFKSDEDGVGLYTVGEFNLEASKKYYAELDIYIPSSHNGSHGIGLAHYKSETEAYSSVMDLGDLNFSSAMTPVSNREDGTYTEAVTPYFTNWRVTEYRGIDVGVVTGQEANVSMTIVRDGDWFYTFIAGKYVQSTNIRAFKDYDTVPGIYLKSPGCGSDFIMSNIEFSNNPSEVDAKLNSVLHNGSGENSIIGQYVPNTWANGSKNTDNKNFTVNPWSEEEGINFDFTALGQDTNEGMVSTYQYFDGDFTFSFDYKNTGYTLAYGNDYMQLEVRPWNMSTDGMYVIGAKFTGKANVTNNELFAKACKDDYWTSGTDVQDEYWPKDTSNWENTYRFQFARKVNETNATYSFKITNVSTGTEVRSGSWTSSYVNGTINTWKEPILMHWKNKGSGGHYSNIAWSSSYDL